MTSSLVMEDWSEAEVTDGVAFMFSGVMVDVGEFDGVICLLWKKDCNDWSCKMKIMSKSCVDVMMDVDIVKVSWRWKGK